MRYSDQNKQNVYCTKTHHFQLPICLSKSSGIPIERKSTTIPPFLKANSKSVAKSSQKKSKGKMKFDLVSRAWQINKFNVEYGPSQKLYQINIYVIKTM